jgi:hypothetical protein
MWHVDPLLDNDSEISNYTTSVARQQLRRQTRTQQLHCKRGTVIYVPSVPRCYKQNKLVGLVRSWFVS